MRHERALAVAPPPPIIKGIYHPRADNAFESLNDYLVANFHGQQRRNDMRESRTDPDAKLDRKSGGSEAHLSYLGNVLIENRNALIVGAMLTTADGTAEADAVVLMAHALRRKRPRGRITLAADKACDQRELVQTAAAARSHNACGAKQQAAPERD